MSMNVVTLLYLVASVCFIQALKGLSNPKSARRGNLFGMVGMAIAILTTVALIAKQAAWLGANLPLGLALVFGALVIGGAVGAVIAARVEMTKMPELVAAMHSLIGLAAVCIAIAVVAEPEAFGLVPQDASAPNFIPYGNRIELFIGTFVGAITFSGSVIAFGKLSGKYRFRLFQGAPVVYPGQHLINLMLALAMLGFGILFFITQSWLPFGIMTAIAFALGVLIIIPIGGADMPVVVSMLNSYSGWAAAGIGFSLNNAMLIIAGSLVGSSGAILSYIMCHAMNRSFFNVILGGFGGDAAAATAGGAKEQRPVKSGSAEDASFMLGNAETVVIVPGYGLAVARAQHALKELTDKLVEKGIDVKYAIHPVAGRMPGHMNVLLAEAEVPYEIVHEMEDINGEFGQVDVVLVLGANDVVNPAAKNDPKSPIAGMPIIEAYKARTVIVNKRSMAAGYAGLDNELFYMDKTMMVFGDAKKVIEDMVKSVSDAAARPAGGRAFDASRGGYRGERDARGGSCVVGGESCPSACGPCLDGNWSIRRFSLGGGGSRGIVFGLPRMRTLSGSRRREPRRASALASHGARSPQPAACSPQPAARNPQPATRNAQPAAALRLRRLPLPTTVCNLPLVTRVERTPPRRACSRSPAANAAGTIGGTRNELANETRPRRASAFRRDARRADLRVGGLAALLAGLDLLVRVLRRDDLACTPFPQARPGACRASDARWRACGARTQPEDHSRRRERRQRRAHRRDGRRMARPAHAVRLAPGGARQRARDRGLRDLLRGAARESLCVEHRRGEARSAGDLIRPVPFRPAPDVFRRNGDIFREPDRRPVDMGMAVRRGARGGRRRAARRRGALPERASRWLPRVLRARALAARAARLVTPPRTWRHAAATDGQQRPRAARRGSRVRRAKRIGR